MPPNILCVIADDMRYDQLDYMPNVRRYIRDRGTTFRMARVNVAICQAARISLLTGQLAHHTGAIGNGQLGTLDHNNSLVKWIRDAGYRTGFIGKYLNSIDDAGITTGKFTGYDTLVEFCGIDPAEQGQWSYHFNWSNGTTITAVSGIHQLDFLLSNAQSFIGSSEPWALFLMPTTPHTPFEPQPPNLHKWADLQLNVAVATNVSTRPSWIQASALNTDAEIANHRNAFRQQVRELASLDDRLGTLLGGMTTTQLDNTLLVFASDNGMYAGEHRNHGVGINKYDPYEVCVKVPLCIAGGGYPVGVNVDVPVQLFVDLSASLLTAAGGAASASFPPDGIDLKPLALNPSSYTSRQLLHFKGNSPGGMTLCVDPADTISTVQYKLIRWQNQVDPNKYELFDLVNDPNEWTNRAYDGGSWLTLRNQLEADLNAKLAT